MIVRTITGDIAPQQLGLTLGHEHVFARPPAEVTDPDLYLDDEECAAAELVAFRQAGGGAIIEMTTVDYGRDVAALARLARRTGVHVIAATGYNKGKFADRISSKLSTPAIAAWMIGEVRDGADGTAHPAGVIKASSSLNGPTADERRVFEAAAEAHRATGAPVSTHTERGTWALEQVELLGRFGVAPHRILVGHLDLRPDIGYLSEVAATGAFLGFDQFGKAKYLPDGERVRLIVALVAAGYGGRVIISGDMARRSYHVAYGGGPGLAHIPSTVLPALREAGLSDADVRQIGVLNPMHFLSFYGRGFPAGESQQGA